MRGGVACLHPLRKPASRSARSNPRLTKKIGCTPLECFDRGIMALEVVTDFGICQCLTHFGGKAAACVAAQINHGPSSLLPAKRNGRCERDGNAFLRPLRSDQPCPASVPLCEP